MKAKLGTTSILRYLGRSAVRESSRPRKAPPRAGLTPVRGKSAASLATKGKRRQRWIDRSGPASEPSSECP